MDDVKGLVIALQGKGAAPTSDIPLPRPRPLFTPYDAIPEGMSDPTDKQGLIGLEPGMQYATRGVEDKKFRSRELAPERIWRSNRIDPDTVMKKLLPPGKTDFMEELLMRLFNDSDEVIY